LTLLESDYLATLKFPDIVNSTEFREKMNDLASEQIFAQILAMSKLSDDDNDMTDEQSHRETLSIVNLMLNNPYCFNVFTALSGLSNEDAKRFFQLATIAKPNDEEKKEINKLLSPQVHKAGMISYTLLLQTIMKEEYGKDPAKKRLEQLVSRRTAVAIMNKHQKEYAEFMSAIENDYELLFKISNANRLPERFAKKVLSCGEVNIICEDIFLKYTTSSDNGSGWYYFENQVNDWCKDIHGKIKFEQFLASHEYGKVFCSEYLDYINTKKLPTKFNAAGILGVKSNLQVDRDVEHESWYVKVPEERYLNKSTQGQYEALSLLYRKLVEKGQVEENCQEVFVYRFSGIGGPCKPNKKLHWTGNNKNSLAILIDFLYRPKQMSVKEYAKQEEWKRNNPMTSVDEQPFDSPRGDIQFKAFSEYFDMSTNLAQLSKSAKYGNDSNHKQSPNVGEILRIMKGCGFNVEDIEEAMNTR